MKEWKKISDTDKIVIGSLVKGYTYSIGDYHNNLEKISKEYLGRPKLRTGIIIKVFNNKIFKVQFWNSAAMNPKKQNQANRIHYKFQNSKEKHLICGTDTYCILLQRKQITFINKRQSFIVGNIQKIQTKILSKHTREKKATIRYINSQNFNGLPKDKIDEIFEEWQFTKKEKHLTHEKAWEKFEILISRHNSKNCVDNEYKKIKNINKFLKKEKMNYNDRLNYQKFLNSALEEFSILRFAKKIRKIKNLSEKNDSALIKEYLDENFPHLNLELKSDFEFWNKETNQNIFKEKETYNNFLKFLNLIFKNFLHSLKESEQKEEHYLPDLIFIEKLINFTIKILQEKIEEINFEKIKTDKMNKEEIKNYFEEKINFEEINNAFFKKFIVNKNLLELLDNELKKDDNERDNDF